MGGRVGKNTYSKNQPNPTPFYIYSHPPALLR
jgi:hypothetical protein